MVPLNIKRKLISYVVPSINIDYRTFLKIVFLKSIFTLKKGFKSGKKLNYTPHLMQRKGIISSLCGICWDDLRPPGWFPLPSRHLPRPPLHLRQVSCTSYIFNIILSLCQRKYYLRGSLQKVFLLTFQSSLLISSGSNFSVLDLPSQFSVYSLSPTWVEICDLVEGHDP